jgi:hypothetical protein
VYTCTAHPNSNIDVSNVTCTVVMVQFFVLHDKPKQGNYAR